MAEATEQRYFEDVDPGDEYDSTWTPETEMVVNYLNASDRFGGGDGRFTDPEAAKKLGMPGPIVPGAFSLSVLTRIVNDWAGMEGRVRSVDVNFRRPVQHNKELGAKALVTDTDAGTASEAGLGRVTMDVFLENEEGERPVQGTAIVDLPLRA